eukprot:Hpha_TRINITY_DN16059_c3_g5::TRINITY_DN16059_c3_g5_i1::g.117213::m.117213
MEGGVQFAAAAQWPAGYSGAPPAPAAPPGTSPNRFPSRSAPAVPPPVTARSESVPVSDGQREVDDKWTAAEAERVAAVVRADAAERRQRETEERCDVAMLSMKKDLERANDHLRMLVSERKTCDKMRELLDELRKENAELRTASVAAEVTARRVAESIPRSEADRTRDASPSPAPAPAPAPPDTTEKRKREEAEEERDQMRAEVVRLTTELERVVENAERAVVEVNKDKEREAELVESETLRRRLAAVQGEMERVREENLRLRMLEQGELPSQKARSDALAEASSQLRAALSDERVRREELRAELSASHREASVLRDALASAERQKQQAQAEASTLRTRMRLSNPDHHRAFAPLHAPPVENEAQWEDAKSVLERQVLEAELRLQDVLSQAQSHMQ